MTDVKEKLGDELYNQVKEKLGDDSTKLIFNDNGNWLPKDRFDKVNTQKAELEKQVKSIEKKVKEFEPLTKDNAELRESVTKLTGQIETSQKEYNDNVASITKNHAIDTAIIEQGGKNPKTINPLLNQSLISLDGSNLVGLNEQLKKLKESDGYLFGETKKLGNEPEKSDKPNTPGKWGGFNTKTELAINNPALYTELEKQGKI